MMAGRSDSVKLGDNKQSTYTTLVALDEIEEESLGDQEMRLLFSSKIKEVKRDKDAFYKFNLSYWFPRLTRYMKLVNPQNQLFPCLEFPGEKEIVGGISYTLACRYRKFDSAEDAKDYMMNRIEGARWSQKHIYQSNRLLKKKVDEVKWGPKNLISNINRMFSDKYDNKTDYLGILNEPFGR
jgi:hypothetical protein